MFDDLNQKVTVIRIKFAAQCKALTVLILLALLQACAASVVVTNEIPQPLVERVPLNVHVQYSEEFQTFKYEETQKRRRSTLRSFDMSAAQLGTFQRSFKAVLNVVPEAFEGRDLTIQPELIDFQYSAPGETRLKHYEVWLKYRLRVLDASDNQVGDWVIKGYGKTPSSLMMGKGSGFAAAADVALRDVGAQITTRLPKQEVIKNLLKVDQAGSVDSEAGSTSTADDGVTEDGESL